MAKRMRTALLAAALLGLGFGAGGARARNKGRRARKGWASS